MRNRLVPEDRIRTLSLAVIHDVDAPNDFVLQQMAFQCAHELVTKLFEHHKIKTIKREDGGYAHYVDLDIIVPPKESTND